MRTLPAILTAAVLLACAPSAGAGETATATINVHVQLASRTSLAVSNDVLHFDVVPGGTSSTAAIEFNAGARVARGADVVLTVESEDGTQGGAVDDATTSITFEGEGDGTLAGALQGSGPAIAGRWQGSGLRRGRVRFTLHSSVS